MNSSTNILNRIEYEAAKIMERDSCDFKTAYDKVLLENPKLTAELVESRNKGIKAMEQEKALKQLKIRNKFRDSKKPTRVAPRTGVKKRKHVTSR